MGVEVYPYGLGASTRSATFDIKGDSTRPTKDGQVAQIRRFSDVIEELSIVRIDLLQINCEGCEWEVLESVIDDKQTHIFQHIQVQFHPSADWVEDRLDRYAAIQDRLTETQITVRPPLDLAALAGEVHPTFLAYYNAKLMSRCVFLIAFYGSHVAKDALLRVPENAIRLDEGEENVNTWRIHGLCVNSTNETHVLSIKHRISST